MIRIEENLNKLCHFVQYRYIGSQKYREILVTKVLNKWLTMTISKKDTILLNHVEPNNSILALTLQNLRKLHRKLSQLNKGI